MARLSKPQEATLKAVIANGGVVDGFAGRRGFYVNSIRPLTRMGLLATVANCENCDHARDDRYAELEKGGLDYPVAMKQASEEFPCLSPLSFNGKNSTCYNRVKVTEAGREAARD